MKNKSIFLRPLFIAFLVTGMITTGCASNSVSNDETQQQVLAWNQEALFKTLTYDYTNYRTQLGAASNYFTPEAWHIYFSALNASSSFKRLVSYKMVASANVQGTPTIIDQGVNSQSQPYWKIRTPMLVMQENSQRHYQQNAVITTKVIQTNNQTGVRGFAISEVVVKEENPAGPVAQTQ